MGNVMRVPTIPVNSRSVGVVLCAGKRATENNNLTKDAELLAQFDKEKNANINPADLRLDQKRKFGEIAKKDLITYGKLQYVTDQWCPFCIGRRCQLQIVWLNNTLKLQLNGIRQKMVI